MIEPLANFFHRTTFRRQISVSVAVGIFFLALCSSLASSWQGSRKIRDNLVEQGKRIAENLAAQSKLALLYASPENAAEAINVTLAFPDITGIEIRDAGGRLLLTKGKNTEAAQTDTATPASPALQKGHAYVERELDDAWHYVAPEMTGGGQSPFEVEERSQKLLGYVRVVQSTDTLVRMMRDVFVTNLAIAFFFALLFLLVIRLLTVRLTQPLIALSEAMAHAERGDGAVKADEHAGPKDIATMAHAFNSMMAAIQEKSAAVERYRDRLELLVDARTAELSDANEQLKKINCELEETHEQLLQSEKLASIGQLAAGVAHEINNPIGFVNSNLSTLEGYLDDLLRLLETYERHEARLHEQGRQIAELEAVKREVDLRYLKDDIPELMAESKEGLDRVKKIVLDLKEFSHVGQSDWQYADLHRGLDSTLNVVRNELKYKVQVIKEYGQVPEIECLPSELNQVFLNILVNASHAIADEGIITIRTGLEDKQAWVIIADNGSGIEPANLKRIFDPFFTTKPVGRGTGLGLSLSYGIVKRHHGRIDVESEVGRGTLFRILLPLVQPQS